MKKIFTLIAMAAMAISANAQRIDFEDGEKKDYFVSGNFKLEYVDTDGKLVVDENNCYFGTADSQEKFTHRLKSGGKSSSKNNMTLSIPAAGTLKIYPRTGSNSATDRTLVLTQNEVEIFNQVIEEANAVLVTGLDAADPTKETKVYPIISVSVEAGSVAVGYPIGSMNFYAFEFVASTGIDTVKTAAENTSIYNLAGQKVSENYKGVVIKNGKKIVMK